MRAKDVKIGGVYLTKVAGVLVKVKVTKRTAPERSAGGAQLPRWHVERVDNGAKLPRTLTATALRSAESP